MAENVLERMERTGAREFIREFMEMQKWPYERKILHAQLKSMDFMDECKRRGLNYHVSVGGLDSITLLLFLRESFKKYPEIQIPAISASYLEDVSIQRVHRQLGVECLKPLKRPDGTLWTKEKVIREFGFPVLSKEIAGKIALLQHPTEKNKTVRHAIITGETGAYGGNRKHSNMKLAQKWLDIFGGYENEREGTNYRCPNFCVSDRCCYYLKERPCDLWAKEHHSVPFLGLMASEGGRREKSLKMHGCNYFGASTIRAAPFAIFQRQDLLRLALELNVPVPEIYGKIVQDPDGTLRTTGEQRTGCDICGFGVHMDKRPHKFDKIKQRNPRAWERLMYHLCKDPDTGEEYGWGRVLTYIGVEWETPWDGNLPGQINLFKKDGT